MKKYITIIMILMVLGLGFYIFQYEIKSCSSPVQPKKYNPVVSITPVSVSVAVKKVLPKNVIAKTQIDVPQPPRVIGKKINQHIIVTEKGNTLSVVTEQIDWGFRADPKIFFGYSDDLFLGVGVSFFRCWRFTGNVFAGGDLVQNFQPENLFLAAGVSYQISNNTYLGVFVRENISLQPSIGFAISLNF